MSEGGGSQSNPTRPSPTSRIQCTSKDWCSFIPFMLRKWKVGHHLSFRLILSQPYSQLTCLYVIEGVTGSDTTPLSLHLRSLQKV